jgi:hypothetical protein
VNFAVADIDVPLISLRSGSHHNHEPISSSIFHRNPPADASGGSLQAHALSDLSVEISFSTPSSDSLPSLLRVYCKYQQQPLQTLPAKSPSPAASFDIDGARHLLLFFACAHAQPQASQPSPSPSTSSTSTSPALSYPTSLFLSRRPLSPPSLSPPSHALGSTLSRAPFSPPPPPSSSSSISTSAAGSWSIMRAPTLAACPFASHR